MKKYKGTASDDTVFSGFLGEDLLRLLGRAINDREQQCTLHISWGRSLQSMGKGQGRRKEETEELACMEGLRGSRGRRGRAGGSKGE